ncbi:MAG: peptide deformylase [Hyphomicrobiaceae bacterium]
MARREIIKVPDPLLRETSKPVEAFDERLGRLVADMLETMYDAPGIGLAAVQIAVPLRLLVIDTAKPNEEAPRPVAMVNPQIVEIVGDELRSHEEGCLSIPDVYAEIERPARVRVSYQDTTGARHEMLAEDLMATVVQHEIDHLNGKLFIDYLSRLKRDRIVKKMIKAKRDAEAAV